MGLYRWRSTGRQTIASAVDEYAAATLAKYLQQMTGAEFPVVAATDADDEGPAIFVGVSRPAAQRLGEQDPLAELEDQEHVCRSEGEDVLSLIHI